jgi:hypothetical protein
MPGYVPPHLRGKKSTVALKKTGVRWPSNAHGDPSANVKSKKAPTSYRNTNQTRSQKYRKQSYQLSHRTLRTKALKSSLKSGTRKARPTSAPAKL